MGPERSTIWVTRSARPVLIFVAWSAVSLPSATALSICAVSSATIAAMSPSLVLPAVAAATSASVLPERSCV